MPQKPFSQACENNKDPILQIIRAVFSQPTTVWEIGSGTGQHGCYFAKHLPHIIWQPTDRAENLNGIRLWQDSAQQANLLPPIKLDVCDQPWPCDTMDAVFTANTLHIMSQEQVSIFFAKLATHLTQKAVLCIYGPFNYQGAYTSDSNARFDQWLKDRDPASGIKHIEDILQLATQAGLELVSDFAMPANNRLLVLQSHTTD
jgi:cyclopropane fatty-acyl-phospholipid synthase-like methyltransferase